MPIEGFNYKEFAADMAKQAVTILQQQSDNAVPEAVSPQNIKIISESIKRLCIMAGEALNNDANIKFTANQAAWIVQLIAEQTFHKHIDMINGKIPEQARSSVINPIVSNVFSTAKLAIIKKMPTEQVVDVIEKKVKNIYAEELQKLIKKGILTQDQYEYAVNMSNAENMVNMNEEQEKLENIQKNPAAAPAPNDKKVLKLAAMAILLKKLPKEKAEAILNSFSKEDVIHITNYMKMRDIENKIDHKLIIKSLNEIKQLIPEPETVNVEKILKHYRKTIKTARLDTLSRLAMYERDNVKDFILDSRFPAANVFSPMVIQSLVNTIENKLNDN